MSNSSNSSNSYRYILAGSKVEKLDCPYCKAKKHWQRYIDTESGKAIHEKYGRCDNEDKCSRWVAPGNNVVTKSAARKIEFIQILSTPSVEIDYSKKCFSEIDTYAKGNDNKGVLFYYSTQDLQGRLNSYVSDGSKNNNPAILKGIYRNGTAGSFCEEPAPFLFFDIDVKENENSQLLNPKANSKVFEVLREFCLLVWRSNSQKGIAGVVYFPQLSGIGSNEAERHLRIARQAFEYLSEYLKSSTGIEVVFDNQQGKFRQIRYLAEQKQPREINKNSKCLVFQFLPFVPFPYNIFKQTLQPGHYEKNTFIQNLFHSVPFPFAADDITKVIQLYRLGTVANGYRSGGITFPFIDIKGNVRAVQVKQFNEQNHTTGTDFLHSIIEKHHTRNNEPLPEWLEAYKKQDKFISCLFGEHLLTKYPNATVWLFEAPKTAIYTALYIGSPEQSNIICMAVYNKSSFSYDKLKVLQGRFINVFPDLSKDGSTFKEWETKVKEYENRLHGTRFAVDNLLELLAPDQDRKNGNDLADYLIKQDWRLFRKKNIQEQPPQPELERITGITKITHQQNIFFSQAEPLPKVEVLKVERIKYPIQEQPQTWSNDITELENYFASIELPTQPVKLNQGSTIKDCSIFIGSHFATVKAYNGKRAFLPYLNRLKGLKQVLTINSI